MKNLVLGYIHATDVKKSEVLHLIAKILEFTENELDQALSGLSRGRGWLAGLWNARTARQQESGVCNSHLFVHTLSTPQNVATLLIRTD